MSAANALPTFGDDGRSLHIENDLLWVNGNNGQPWTMDHAMQFWTHPYDSNGGWRWVRADKFYFDKYRNMTTALFNAFQRKWIDDWLGRLTAVAMESLTANRLRHRKRKAIPRRTHQNQRRVTKMALDQQLGEFKSKDCGRPVL